MFTTVDNCLLTTPPAFKDLEGDERHHYLPLIDDNPKGKGMLIASIYGQTLGLY